MAQELLLSKLEYWLNNLCVCLDIELSFRKTNVLLSMVAV